VYHLGQRLKLTKSLCAILCACQRAVSDGTLDVECTINLNISFINVFAYQVVNDTVLSDGILIY
jgi:hypothetical protein